MKILKRYDLDFEQAWKYTSYNLEGGNALSIESLNLINSVPGRFFTLLPDDANIEKRHEFEIGGILSQDAEQEYFISGKIAAYSIIPTIQDELCDFIIARTKENKKLACVFEEVLDSLKSPNLEFFRKHDLLLRHNNEVYYLARNDCVNHELISKCIKKSNAIWHSLCVLTAIDPMGFINEELQLEKIIEICSNSELIIIGAYDGEGYIFWEENRQVEK